MVTMKLIARIVFPVHSTPRQRKLLTRLMNIHTLLTGNVDTAASVLAPGKCPVEVGKPDKVINIIHFHVSSGHQHERLLREIAQKHGITLTGVLHACGGCLEAKGIRAGTPRRSAQGDP